MKRPEWIFVGVLVPIASYFTFSYYTKKNAFKEWNLVPANSVIVDENKSTIDIWN